MQIFFHCLVILQHGRREHTLQFGPLWSPLQPSQKIQATRRHSCQTRVKLMFFEDPFFSCIYDAYSQST